MLCKFIFHRLKKLNSILFVLTYLVLGIEAASFCPPFGRAKDIADSPTLFSKRHVSRERHVSFAEKGNTQNNKKRQTIMNVQLINQSKHATPQYATPLSAGVDLRANLEEPIELLPLQRKLIKTGLFIALPEGYEAQVRPRSGLAYKKGVTVLNSPGTIDADYRGEIGVLLVNLSSEPFVVEDGERIAQLVVAKHETVEWQEVEQLEETTRGAGGFGSTGTK